MEALGAKLDESGVVLATGAIQLGFLSLIGSALIAFLYTVFSGQLTTMPGRLAAMPEQAAQSLGLNVTRVTLKGGKTLTTREIMGALYDDSRGSVIGRPLLTLDPQDLREAIEALGPVEVAAVQKLLPNTIHISVVERQPVALYEDGEGQFFAIDRDGVVVRPTEVTGYTDLLTVSGTKEPAIAMPFYAELSKRPVLFARASAIEVVGDRRVNLRFRNGFYAKMPETDVAEALDRLDALNAGKGTLSAKFDYLDLRGPEFAYVGQRESAREAR